MAKAAGLLAGEGRAGVKQSIADVDGPGNKADEGWSPERQTYACGEGKAERPDDGDGWRVQRGHVPKGKRKRRVEAAWGRSMGRNGIGNRVQEGPLVGA